MKRLVIFAVGAIALVGCTTSERGMVDGIEPIDGSDSRPETPTGCVPTQTIEASCEDGADNDCDGLSDCDDPDCTAMCNGTIMEPSSEDCGDAVHGGDTLAIPDGDGASYETSVTIAGFEEGQTLGDLNGFKGTCVTMEHSWLRDLQIELICPSGETVVLQEFLGTNGGLLQMGEPNEDDEGGFFDDEVTDPVPGAGYEYCWTPDAINPPMLTWGDENPDDETLPAGSYQASDGYSPLLGCELNGVWTIRATDDWGIDNGFIFDWSVEFDSSLIPDCSEWVVY